MVHHATNRTGGPWPNVTLNGSGISCVVALPDARRGFYRNTRFDWGSMVGTITLPLPDRSGNVTLSGDARSPAGFVAEFGCGGSGALCPTPPASPGRSYSASVTNGVLGFGDAGKGGEFLKVGVGRLRRPKAGRGGSHYETTWPYELAEAPQWDVIRDSRTPEGVTLQQSVRFKRWGWQLRRRVYTCDWPRKQAGLCIDIQLTNRGEQSLRTPYCSHNLFNLAAVSAAVGVQRPRSAITALLPVVSAVQQGRAAGHLVA